MDSVSVILPIYRAQPSAVQKFVDALNMQKTSKRINYILVDKGNSPESLAMISALKKKNTTLTTIPVDVSINFSSSMNTGLKNVKDDVAIILQQDCIPQGEQWIDKIIAPFDDLQVVATVSKVELPYELWNSFDTLGKLLSAKEQRLITPLLDEKGCAYRMKEMRQVGYFDEKTFYSAGEDFDIYLKLTSLGKIAYPDIQLIHYHHYNGRKRLNKEIQLANGFGTLVRLYGRRMPRWYLGIAKAVPVLGYFIQVATTPFEKLGFKSLMTFPVSLLVHALYVCGFWVGFLEKEQTLDTSSLF